MPERRTRYTSAVKRDCGVPERRIIYRFEAKLYFMQPQGGYQEIPLEGPKGPRVAKMSLGEFGQLPVTENSHNFDTCKNIEKYLPKPFKKMQQQHL